MEVVLQDVGRAAGAEEETLSTGRGAPQPLCTAAATTNSTMFVCKYSISSSKTIILPTSSSKNTFVWHRRVDPNGFHYPYPRWHSSLSFGTSGPQGSVHYSEHVLNLEEAYALISIVFSWWCPCPTEFNIYQTSLSRATHISLPHYARIPYSAGIDTLCAIPLYAREAIDSPALLTPVASSRLSFEENLGSFVWWHRLDC